MPDMQIYCDHCGCDRFTVNKTKPMDVAVNALICRACGTPTGADSVVVFTERTWLSQIPVIDNAPLRALPVG
ncbi:hypothetical protein ACMV8I_04595 [Ewingella sp. S1.OA.A_B6]